MAGRKTTTTKKNGKGLWVRIPSVYKQCVFSCNFLECDVTNTLVIMLEYQKNI